MKSPLNYKAIHSDGTVYDMHELGWWVESFHIHSQNVIRDIQFLGGKERLRKTRLGSRQVDIGVQVEESSIRGLDEQKHLFYTATYSVEPIKIIRDITPDRYILIYQEGSYDIDNLTDSDGVFSLSLRMLEPFLFGEEKQLSITTSYANRTVTGQVNTPWKSRTVFSSAATSFTLENDNGGRILLNYNFVQGDILEIDYLKRKITVSGTVRPEILSMQSYWFDLKPGVNRLRASHATTITYEERFN
ncbi:hypothetical protein BTS2_0531 [Bacillus sp. TS-2]|nr:hypothetical protein BTS2_0531 [Bacillus sp. TS-2]